MSRRRQQHYYQLPRFLKEYCRERDFEFQVYSEFHMRVIDPTFTCVDIWTTAKYYIKETNYCHMTDEPILERGGETGRLPIQKPALFDFLDRIFYAPDMQGAVEKNLLV